MKILGIVILYYPEDDVEENIASYLTYLDRLIIWDNTPADKKRELCISDEKVIHMGTGANVGIGKALNEGVRYAQENGYTHLLTMDQDSRFPPHSFARYIQSVESFSHRNDIASFAVEVHENTSEQEHEYVDICITSGTIYNVAIFKEIGNFREDFFIDAVDTEFCYRIKRKGLKNLRFNSIVMHHRLGNVTIHPFLWGKLITPNYSAQRTYYLIRNTLSLRHLYPEYKLQQGTIKTILYWRIITIIFVEKDKVNKLKAVLLGLAHALFHKTGEYQL